MNSQIKDKNIYIKDTYTNKDRFVSYFWQTRLTKHYSKPGDSILEIGLGNGVVANLLELNHFKITTLDINPDLNPDIIASADDLSSIKDKQFDTIVCFEVLEHLPFDKFIPILQEFNRISRHKIIISLPYWGFTFGFKAKLPLFGSCTIKFKLNGFKKHLMDNSAGHYWEIGKVGFSLSKIKKVIRHNGFKIEKNFWDLDDPYHQYFILTK